MICMRFSLNANEIIATGLSHFVRGKGCMGKTLALHNCKSGKRLLARLVQYEQRTKRTLLPAHTLVRVFPLLGIKIS